MKMMIVLEQFDFVVDQIISFYFQIFLSLMKGKKKLKIVNDNQTSPPNFLVMQSVMSIPDQSNLNIQTLPTGQRLITNDMKNSKQGQKQRRTSIVLQKPINSQPTFKNRLTQKMIKKMSSNIATQKSMQINFPPLQKNRMSAQQMKKDPENTSNLKFIFEKNNILEQRIRSLKIKKLQRNFVNKLIRSCAQSQPVDLSAFDIDQQKSGWLNTTGIQLPAIVSNIMNLVGVVLILLLIAIYTISLVFQNIITSDSILSYIQIGGFCFYVIELLLNLISIKYEAGKKIQVVKQIMLFYAGKGLWIDLINVFILLLDVGTNYSVTHIFRLFIIFKLPQCSQQIQKLQVFFVQNIYNEQYWQLVKVFLFNFIYAHVIALFLAAMADLSEQKNWMTEMQIDKSTWSQQYIWSFYWATNIMLTVGFGDIHATNTREAMSLVIIQTFSCIVMAYNVNCMGTIISKIRAQDQNRSKKFKVFKKMAHNSNISQQLTDKINNYIEESSNMKKIFNYEQEKQFINDLPVTLKTNFLKESNKLILTELIFFKGLLDKTLSGFAQVLQTSISHPQEIIRSLEDDFSLMILKKGQIGYICKKNQSKYNDRIVDLITIGDGQNPFLTGLQFLSKKKPVYQIKSLTFSVIYMLEYNKFIEVFRENNLDYELYCLIRDKIRNIPDQFEVYPCQLCKGRFNHFKFTCPKLHYTPLQQHTINKYLYKQKTQKSKRICVTRKSKNPQSRQQFRWALSFYQKISSFKVTNKSKTSLRIKSTSSGKGWKKKSNKGPANNTFQNIKQALLKDIGTYIVKQDSNTKQQTRQLIQLQFLKKRKENNFNDEIWVINLDEMKDYSSYFKQNNPSELSAKYDPAKRIKMRQQSDAYSLEIQSDAYLFQDGIQDNQLIQEVLEG